MLAISARPALAEGKVLLAFGDSLTQGYGLAAGDGFVPQLENWLRVNGAPEVVVINGGVSGDTTAGGASRIAWSLTDDVDAVLVTLGGNDLLRGISPEETKKNLALILSETQARGLPTLLAGMEAVSNYGADYKTAFDALYPEVAAEHGAAFYPQFMAGMIEATGGGTQNAAALMQGDGIHPNKEGVALNVAAIGPIVLALLGVE